MAGKRASDFVQQLNTQFGQFKSERAPFDDIWRKVAVFESERMTLFDGQLGNNPAQAMRRDVRDVDNTCRQAITVFSSGMLSGVSPPSDQWFTLRIADKSGGDDLKKYRPVANWLEQIERLFLKDFTAKNFYTQQVSSYKHIGLYGMQAMLVGESPQMGTYYRDVPVDEIYIANDYAGRVNVVYREMRITLQQALTMFGKENLSPCLQALAEDRNANPQEHVTIVHAVMEKAPGYENIIGDNKLAYASYYFEPGEDHLISEGGFDSLPYIVTRAYSDGRSPYSISPGTIALADVLMINEIKRLMLQAGQLSVAPPMLLPDRGLVGRLNYTSGALNTYRKDGSGIDVNDFQPLKLVGEFKLGMELMQQAQKDVNAAFFVDLFLMIHNRTQAGKGTPTAMEIEQLATEKSFLLAPILINQQQENFNRLFERVFEIKKKEHGAIPEPPKELLNADIEIEYISPLVRAQQGVRTQQMLQGLQELGGIANLFPDVMDIVDSDAITRRIIESRGIPQSCIRTVEEVMGLRQQKMQAQEAAQKEMQQQQMLAGMMQGYEGLSKAPEAGSPVQSIMQQTAGGM
ncbi:MAG: portal protein [Desulfovibrio sp.]|uniref:portal protein n=1 Tax=Desulfovibrio sp. TaxID=885 RepID=UPI002A366C6F|nr:portal protein [Desulfovibrio sp.]MDY0258646.1 portal protein [Desulfovibrio sp.]